MFGLFKKADAVKVNDKIWLSSTAKWRACVQMAAADPGCLFVAWFEDTVSEMTSAGIAADRIILADKLASTSANRMIIFAEHYPMRSVEQAMFAKLNLSDVPVLLSIDEPLLEPFGSARMIELMKSMGVKDDEVLSHAMITRSIKNAQEKIESKVKVPQSARSQREWMKLNVGN